MKNKKIILGIVIAIAVIFFACFIFSGKNEEEIKTEIKVEKAQQDAANKEKQIKSMDSGILGE